MEAHNEMHARLLRARTYTCHHIMSFINSMTLKLATELNIPDIIHKHGKPMPLPQLTSSLQIHPSKSHNLCRLMRILTHFGFFSLQMVPETDPSEEGYVLTDASTLLLKDSPFSLAPFALAAMDPVLTKPWYEMTNWFQNDDSTPFETAFGKTFWEYAGDDSKFNRFFNEGMANETRSMTSAMVEKCEGVFEGLDTLVDVGGGTGTAAKVIAEAFPKMECIVFDLSHVVAGLQDSGNLKFVGGNMFEAVPPANAILLKSVLHDWNDEECVKILKKCKEAIASKEKKGKVIIVDVITENEKGDNNKLSHETLLLHDMMMMVFSTGKERTEKEWADLIFSAGFSDYKITPILGLESLIELQVYP